MKEVSFKDGRVIKVDADMFLCSAGNVSLYKRIDGTNQQVVSYPAELVKDVIEYKDNPIKMLAVKLLQACGRVPHGSRKLCQTAGVEYNDLVIPVLKKLRQAGKVSFNQGKWARV